MENEYYLFNVWPMLNFKADWSEPAYKFDLDVHLVMNDGHFSFDHIFDMVSEAGYFKKAHDFEKNTTWYFALPPPKPTEHVSCSEIDLSFERELQNAIKDSFLLCLQLVRQTNVICPLTVNNIKFHKVFRECEVYCTPLSN